MTTLLSRAEWGARPPRATPPLIVNEGQTMHYGGPSPWGASVVRSSAPAFMASADHARCSSILRAWQAYHMDTHGWNDIAYNSAVCPHGVRFEGRGVGRKSGANGTNDGNARSCATVGIWGDADPLTDAAKVAYLDECARFGVKPRWQHSDWKPTACAGDPVRAWQAKGWPAPAGAPPTMEDDEMSFLMIRFPAGGIHLVSDAGLDVPIDDSTSYAGLGAAGIKTANLDDNTFAAVRDGLKAVRAGTA